MALKGKAPTAVQKRLKALFFGPPGVGKTTAALQFPAPYLIDTERGAENDQYVRALQKSGGAYLFTTDPDELIEELRSLISEQHGYRTLIIDPLTIIYNDLLDKAADQVGTDFGRHKGPANRKIKHLLSLILRLDMNVIITSHAKAKWIRSKDARGKDTAVQEGVTFDCYDGLDYLFDLVFEVNKRGTERVGIVRKTRIETFPEGEVFPFGYDAIAERYGRDLLEREARAVPLATKEQIDELMELVGDKKDGEAWLAKVLTKADAETVGELTNEQAEKCIEALRKGKVAA
jgi:DNA polymerase III delta prime subunit